jgi:hypothetical protein
MIKFSDAPMPVTEANPTWEVNTTGRTHFRTGIVGTGGIGKTSLAGGMPSPIIIDMEGKAGVLKLPCFDKGVSRYDHVLALLRSDLLDQYDSIVLDSFTRLEQLTVKHVVANIPDPDSGLHVESIDSYGWGKGPTFVYDAVVAILAQLDTLFAKGKNICLIMHECSNIVPNPTGADFQRWEPRLQSPASGKNSVRLLVKEWLDDLLFIGYDIAPSKEKGKVMGSGTRTIYTSERPHIMAKSLTLSKDYPYAKGDFTIWNDLYNK